MIYTVYGLELLFIDLYLVVVMSQLLITDQYNGLTRRAFGESLASALSTSMKTHVYVLLIIGSIRKWNGFFLGPC